MIYWLLEPQYHRWELLLFSFVLNDRCNMIKVDHALIFLKARNWCQGWTTRRMPRYCTGAMMLVIMVAMTMMMVMIKRRMIIDYYCKEKFQTAGGDEPALELSESQEHRHQVPRSLLFPSQLKSCNDKFNRKRRELEGQGPCPLEPLAVHPSLQTHPPSAPSPTSVLLN